MLTKEELLDMARDTNRSQLERFRFWNQYELLCWAEAVIEHGLRFRSFDDNPLYRSQLIEAVRVAQLKLPRSDIVPFVA